MAVSYQPTDAPSDAPATVRDASAHASFADAARDAAARATIVVGLAAIAVIHAVDSVGKWTETRYMFWMYMALVVGAFVTAGGVLLHRSRLPLAAVCGLAATVLAAFVIDRTVGMPQATGDIGNWTEPLRLSSLLIESFVIAIGAASYLRRG